MKTKMTAVEWFEQQLDNLDIETPYVIFSEAKEKEQQEKDNLAIEFAKWIDKNYYQDDIKLDKYARSIEDFTSGESYTIKQLLEIFKKERYGK